MQYRKKSRGSRLIVFSILCLVLSWPLIKSVLQPVTYDFNETAPAELSEMERLRWIAENVDRRAELPEDDSRSWYSGSRFFTLESNEVIPDQTTFTMKRSRPDPERYKDYFEFVKDDKDRLILLIKHTNGAAHVAQKYLYGPEGPLGAITYERDRIEAVDIFAYRDGVYDATANFWPEKDGGELSEGKFRVAGMASANKGAEPEKTNPLHPWSKEEVLAFIAKENRTPSRKDMPDGFVPMAVYLEAAESTGDEKVLVRILLAANPFASVKDGIALEAMAPAEVQGTADYFTRYRAQLLKLLSSKDSNSCLAALKLLHRNAWVAAGGPLHEPTLKLAREATDDVIKAEALRALLAANRQIQSPEVMDLLQQAFSAKPYLAAQAGKTLCEMDIDFTEDKVNPKLKELVLAGLESEQPLLRAYSARIARSLGESVAPRLREMLRNDPETCVRAAAAESLGRMRDQESASILKALMLQGRKESAVVSMGAPRDYSTTTSLSSEQFAPGSGLTTRESYKHALSYF